MTSSPLEATNARTAPATATWCWVLRLQWPWWWRPSVAETASRRVKAGRSSDFGSFFDGGRVGVGPIERHRPKVYTHTEIAIARSCSHKLVGSPGAAMMMKTLRLSFSADLVRYATRHGLVEA